MSWFDYKITKGHPPDDGVDLGTPSGTPVYFPFGGHVIDASYHDYGGQVVAAVPGTQYSEYFIHLDNVYVQPGQDVPPGQVIGTTGGGVGDKVMHNGRVQPAASQSWYDGHSSGPHTEYGLFAGQDMQSFNKGWHNPPRQLDPTAIIAELRGGQSLAWPGTGTPASVSSAPGLGASTVTEILTNAFPWLLNPVALKYRLISAAVATAGVVLIGYGGLYIYAGVKGQPVTQVISDAANASRDKVEQAAKVAGMAAAA